MITSLNLRSTLKPNEVTLPALLGLDGAPTKHDQKDRFFFASPLTFQRLSILNNMVGGRSPVIVVMGERGSGKTTLMNQFVAQTGKRWQVCRIHLKNRKNSAISQWHNLENRMVLLSRKEKRPSVIVDDAHQLTTAELKLLLRTAFPAAGPRRLQSIVLVAEPCMRRHFVTIAGCLPPKAVIDKIFMTPLTEKQTADYLTHRVMTAGFLKRLPFTTEQIRTIHAISRGLPGWINDEAFILLKRLCDAEERAIILPFRSWRRAARSRFRFFNPLQALARY
ncbi:MAG: AAA family ATPase [Desulfatitalea sp.]|nr:AAA family ATPase [Desulfatitalea sp.]NNK01583.1 AAA family ATPase [Desulfatitalea sp.]